MIECCPHPIPSVDYQSIAGTVRAPRGLIGLRRRQLKPELVERHRVGLGGRAIEANRG